MPSVTIEELPYVVDSTVLFACLQDLRMPVFLDSSGPHSTRGRYDILMAQPVEILTAPPADKDSEAGETVDDVFAAVRLAIATSCPAKHNDYHLPFLGGAAGYWGYDLARNLEVLPVLAQSDIDLPRARLGIYNWAIINDHRQRRTVLVSQPTASPTLLREIKSRLAQTPVPTTFKLIGPWHSNLSKAAYTECFDRIQRFIHAGDCYQVNLAQRFSADCEGSPWAAYLALRETAAAPFSAFIGDDQFSILCTSPERFLKFSNGRACTAPIKGTRPRDADPDIDRQLARELQESQKDRAENLMIVDLLRNDLGKVCRPGSIQVDELFELQSFETVHHLVSTISGTLEDSCDALALLRACFPGGSITGAPKIRAMEIIEELEPHRRTVYCGSIGYVSSDGQMDTNIAIRTLLYEKGVGDKNRIHCWAGGGIVADSDCDSEYQECSNKVGALLKTLEKRA